MRQLYADLWQTMPEHPIPGSPALTTHAYLFARAGGNVLFYNSGLADAVPAIEALGGLTHQYLSHSDEVGPSLARIKEQFGSKLCCHRLEEPAVREACPVDSTFDRRERHLGAVEVIPTPGHTRGSACYLVRSDSGKRYLFTGDTIFLNKGAWDTFVIESKGGSKSDLRQSLQLLRGLNPDVVLSSASLGDVSYKETAPGEWRSIVDGALRALT